MQNKAKQLPCIIRSTASCFPLCHLKTLTCTQNTWALKGPCCRIRTVLRSSTVLVAIARHNYHHQCNTTSTWSTNLTASSSASTSSVLQELKSLGFPPRSMWKFFLLCTPSTDTTLHRQDSFKFNIARTHVQGLGGTPSMGFLVESVVQGLVVVEVKDTSRVEDFDASSGCGVLSPASVTGSCSFAPSMYKYSAM